MESNILDAVSYMIDKLEGIGVSVFPAVEINEDHTHATFLIRSQMGAIAYIDIFVDEDCFSVFLSPNEDAQEELYKVVRGNIKKGYNCVHLPNSSKLTVDYAYLKGTEILIGFTGFINIED